MDAPSDTTDNFITVKTTLPVRPLPRNVDRLPIITERLILRALTQDDLEEVWQLRSQPEPMEWTAAGRPDEDKAKSQTRLDAFLPPNDAKTFNWAICLKETGSLVGIGGVHYLAGENGWPEVGYMFRYEHWGKGFATEFLRAFVEAWDQLPREHVELRVKPYSLADGEGGDGDEVDEMLIAVTIGPNQRSHNVLTKCGFERYKIHSEPDLRDPTVDIELILFRHRPGRALKN